MSLLWGIQCQLRCSTDIEFASGNGVITESSHAIGQDLGDYRSREFSGSLKGFNNVNYPDRHCGCLRFVWKGASARLTVLVQLLRPLPIMCKKKLELQNSTVAWHGLITCRCL